MAGKRILNYLINLSSVVSVMENCIENQPESDWRFICQDIKDVAFNAMCEEIPFISEKGIKRIDRFVKLLDKEGLQHFKSNQVYVNWVLGLLSDRRDELMAYDPKHKRLKPINEIIDMLNTLYENSEVFEKYDDESIEFLKKYCTMFEKQF